MSASTANSIPVNNPFFVAGESFVRVLYNNTSSYSPPELGGCTIEEFTVPTTLAEVDAEGRVPKEVDEGAFSVEGTAHKNLRCEYNPFAGLQIPDPSAPPPSIELEGTYVCGGSIEDTGGPFIRINDEFTSPPGQDGSMLLSNRVIDFERFDPVGTSLVMTGMGPPGAVSFLPLEVQGVTDNGVDSTVSVRAFPLNSIDTDMNGPIIRASRSSVATFNVGAITVTPYDFLNGDMVVSKEPSSRVEGFSTTVSPAGEGFLFDNSSMFMGGLPTTDDTASLRFSCNNSDGAEEGDCGAANTDPDGQDVLFFYMEASNGDLFPGPVLAAAKTPGAKYARMTCIFPPDQDVVVSSEDWAKVVSIGGRPQGGFPGPTVRMVVLRASMKTVSNESGFNETVIISGHGVTGATPFLFF